MISPRLDHVHVGRAQSAVYGVHAAQRLAQAPDSCPGQPFEQMAQQQTVRNNDLLCLTERCEELRHTGRGYIRAAFQRRRDIRAIIYHCNPVGSTEMGHNPRQNFGPTIKALIGK